MAEPRKGLRNIRTMTTVTSETLTPHKAYIGAAALELEKKRHMQELRILLHRVNELNARLKKIKEEQGRLTHVLGGREQMQDGKLVNKQNGLKPSLSNNRPGFKIKY